MSCPDELELFLVREGGAEDLSAERAKEISDHLASCAECQAKLAGLQALSQALARPAPLPEAERSAFLSEVVRRIDAHESSTAKVIPMPRRWTVIIPLAAAACCGALALGIGALFFATNGDMDVSASRESMVAAQSAAQPPMAKSLIPQGSEATAESAQMAEEPVGGGGSVAADRSALQSAPPSPSRMPAASTPPMETEASEGQARTKAAPGRVQGAASGIALPPAPARRERRHLGEEGVMGRDSSQSPSKTATSADLGNTWALPSQAAPVPMGQPAAAPPSAIDPNGRFATTYRPGRGHSARFEKTMLQGQNVPEPVIELVADEGRGHGVQLPAPTDRALSLHVTPGLSRLSPAGGPVHLALTLRSTTQQPASRPKVAVHLVIDTSGSMSGTPIEQARQAAQQLVGLLQDGDRFSLISYSSSARVVVSDGPVGARRGQILRQIMGLQAQGGTNLEAGLRAGYEQARQSRTQEDSVQLAIVLSDGRPNQGITNPWVLSEMSAAAFQAEVETTTIGVGDSYEPQVMSAIAEYGAGGYYYLPDASTIEQVLRTELDVRCQPVARAVELRVRLAPGVELLEAYGSRRLNEMEAQRVRRTEVTIDHQEAHRSGIDRDRQEDLEGGMRFFIPGFARDDQHTILLRLRVPAGSAGAIEHLADVELRYKDRVLGTNQGDEQPVNVTYGSSATASLSSQNREVRRAVFSFRTGQALVEVSRLLNRNAYDEALAVLFERVEVLRRAGEQLDDGTLRADADRLDSFRQALLNRTMGNNLMMGSLFQRAGTAFMR